MAHTWENISYLLGGNAKQKKAYEILKKLEVFKVLGKFNPILVGTIPINIDIESSDLDIICEVYDFHRFQNILRTHFGQMKGFNINKDEREGTKTLVSNFIYGKFMIEIFGQPLATIKQNGYKHMIIEEKLLKLGGNDFRKNIIKFKKRGIKTEPAFARYLKIEGDPYHELLKLEGFSDETLLDMIHGKEV